MLAIYLSLNSQARRVLSKLRSSQFARDAVLLLIFNVASKAIGFFGTAYAARCLGPTNLGISALVQATARQVMLAYDGGFSIVGVRKIAADKMNSRPIIETINTFQLGMALMASVLWLIFVFWLAPVNQRFAWALGMPSLIFSATSIVFVFQGLEKLPIQNAIGTVGALLTAGAYLLFFSPGMFLGADLIVMAVVGAITSSMAWGAYYRLFGRWPMGKLNWRALASLLRESWRYWAMAIVIFIFSVYQIPLIAHFLGPRETGIFRSAFVLASGVELLFNSINSLLLARLVAWKQQGLVFMWKQQSRLLRIFLGIGLPAVVICIVMSSFVYRILFGPEFVEGVPVFQVLVVGRLVVFLGQIYSWGMTAIEHDSRLLIVFTLRALSSVILNVLLIPVYGIMAAAMVSLVSDTVIHLYFYFDLHLKTRNAG